MSVCYLRKITYCQTWCCERDCASTAHLPRLTHMSRTLGVRLVLQLRISYIHISLSCCQEVNADILHRMVWNKVFHQCTRSAVWLLNCCSQKWRRTVYMWRWVSCCLLELVVVCRILCFWLWSSWELCTWKSHRSLNVFNCDTIWSFITPLEISYYSV